MFWRVTVAAHDPPLVAANLQLVSVPQDLYRFRQLGHNIPVAVAVLGHQPGPLRVQAVVSEKGRALSLDQLIGGASQLLSQCQLTLGDQYRRVPGLRQPGSLADVVRMVMGDDNAGDGTSF